MVPVVGVDHAPTAAFATEAYTPSQDPSLSVSVSGSKQLSSASGRKLESPPTVSVLAVLTIALLIADNLARV